MPPVAAARRTSRRTLLTVLGAIATLSIAARWQTPVPPARPATTPPAAAPAAFTSQDSAQADTTARDSTLADSVALDSMAMDSLAVDSVPVATAPTSVVSSAAPAWPIDPVTGYTLVNGIPVVGRAFVMRKIDGLVKVETVAQDRINEALPPEAPVVATGYTPAPVTATRRFRGVMVQATLWSIDGKRSSIERRHFRPSAQ